jgi:hypothetical protein
LQNHVAAVVDESEVEGAKDGVLLESVDENASEVRVNDLRQHQNHRRLKKQIIDLNFLRKINKLLCIDNRQSLAVLLYEKEGIVVEL